LKKQEKKCHNIKIDYEKTVNIFFEIVLKRIVKNREGGNFME